MFPPGEYNNDNQDTDNYNYIIVRWGGGGGGGGGGGEGGEGGERRG